MKKIFIIFNLILFSIFSYTTENMGENRIDIGEQPNSVFLIKEPEHNSARIEGRGKIEKNKYSEALRFRGIRTLNINAEVMLPDDSSNLFNYRNTDIQNITFAESLDTSNITNMSSMLSGIQNLSNISNWNVSNVENMSNMFSGTKGFETYISSWNTARLTDISAMFSNVNSDNSRSIELNISNWNVSNITDASRLFSSSSNIKADLSKWALGDSVTKDDLLESVSYMNLNLSNWSFNNDNLFDSSTNSKYILLNINGELILNPNNIFVINSIDNYTFKVGNYKIYNKNKEQINEISIQSDGKLTDEQKRSLNDSKVLIITGNQDISNLEIPNIEDTNKDDTNKDDTNKDNTNKDEPNTNIKKENAIYTANSFYINDTSISNNFNKDIFFKIDFSASIIDVAKEMLNNEKFNNLGIITGFSLGAIKEIGVKDLKLGGFVDYKFKNTHNISLGTIIKYKELDSFIRYRMAVLKNSEKNLYNHNIDIYAKYQKDIKVLDYLSIKPNTSINLLYSSGVDINETYSLKQRVGFNIDLASVVEYTNHKLNLKVYVEPKLSGGYNNQVLMNKIDTNNNHLITREYFKFILRTGVDKTFSNNISIGAEILLDVANNKNLNLGGNINVSYVFK